MSECRHERMAERHDYCPDCGMAGKDARAEKTIADMQARIDNLEMVKKTLLATIERDTEIIARQEMTIHKLMTRGDKTGAVAEAEK